MSAAGYDRLEFELPAAAEERLTGELWAAGTRGLELRDGRDGRLRIVAYFAAAEAARACAERVARHCRDVVLRAHDDLPATDWLREYRRRARPIPVGRRLLVDPGEPEPGRSVAVPPGRRLLRLPARQAFGTGAHASTRLVAEWLEDLDLEGRRVLDVGCGSGILSFAAALAGARPVIAIEIDPVAAIVARDGQRLNRIEFALAAGGAGCLRPGAGFDLLLVNVLPAAVRADLADLRRLLADGGRALFSGLLEADVGEVEARLAAHGFARRQRRDHDGWSALLTVAAAPAAGARTAPC